MLKSEFGHVWLLATLVYLLKVLYVNSCVVCRHIAQFFIFFIFLYILSIVCVYTFFSAAFCTAHCALDLAKDPAP